MAILIKDPDADRIVRELAARTGETITDAVKTAAEERLARLPKPKQGRIDLEKVEKLLAEIRTYRVDDPRTDDEIIGYDENGLPS
ncbi:Antitoxin VapB [Bosea sp. 62]|uniref:type II toxin-antitoxin system VapB family antitoxin n=1 Tax=unclassified Bosea (in: a-proteobacteria) TaxID=2653178 RepID=UPI0012588DBF|nr:MULTISPECIES: type II toxin-antitoxin system VapB family antitoxin [unclassified Bosea (in: a-proteobacteria)]CAD5294238.1 Antitoxin VapB [Bosea sp. 7B]CAD5298000.1 Antitoxin VapB [Bosea sp. 21B]CAD5298177.1 Antitoxin VapB [Bosea sp. 46]VVT61384.1 Antitoxin VapB [Bosea sp. EC-HK365B]VXB17266.1 Antitoxin VapB [Bosea sp. 127]